MNARVNHNRLAVKYFRKWSNKGYGIFASLRVVVKICVISVGYLLLVRPAAAVAQTDTLILSSDRELEEVIISDRKRASSFSELANAVVVISSEEFRSLPVASLQELLEHFASVDIRQRGGHGVQADLMVRGGSFDQVLVLLNGVNITDPQTGHHNLNIPIDLQSIHRIELLQGPGARAYGLGAFSGAINIITSPQGKSFADISSTIGQFGLMKLTSSASISSQKHEFYLAGSTSKSNGFMENTDFKLHNLFAQARFSILSGIFDSQIGIQDKGFGAQSFYTPRFPEQYEKTSTYFASISFTKKSGAVTFMPTAYHRLHNDRFELFRHDAPGWYTGHNHHSTSVSGILFRVSHLSSFGKLHAGLEYRNKGIVSNVLGDILDQPIAVNGFSSVEYTKGKTRNTSNLFTDYTLYFDPFTISAGILFAYSDAFGFAPNYGVDASWSFAKTAKGYVAFNRATRYPTFTDLYYSGPTNVGNPDLMPEIADNFEVGAKFNNSTTSFTVALFHRNGKNVIDWVKDVDAEKWTTKNHTELLTSGFESHISIKTEEIVPIVQRISLGYTYMNSGKASDNLLSYYILDYLKHKANLTVHHKIWGNFSSSWSAIWQDREGTFTDFSTGNELPYDSFFLINFRLNWERKSLKVYGDISNLLNTQFFDLGNVPQPGRWVTFGVYYRLCRH